MEYYIDMSDVTASLLIQSGISNDNTEAPSDIRCTIENHHCHDGLQPFLMDNVALEQYYSQVMVSSNW